MHFSFPTLEGEETVHLETEDHNAEYLNCQQQCCKNLKSHNNHRNLTNKLFCVLLLNNTKIMTSLSSPMFQKCFLWTGR